LGCATLNDLVFKTSEGFPGFERRFAVRSYFFGTGVGFDLHLMVICASSGGLDFKNI
jgi:hypothetical protein